MGLSFRYIHRQEMSRNSNRRKKEAALAAERKLLREILAIQKEKIVAPSTLPLAERFSKIISWIGKTVGAIAVIFGMISGYYQVAAKVSVTATQSVNPKDPFQSAFIVKNEGSTGVKNVRLEYFFNYVALLGYRQNDRIVQEWVFHQNFRIESQSSIQNLSSMSQGEPTSFIFPGLPDLSSGAFIPLRYLFCDVTLVASFRAPFEMWKRQSKFRFVTQHAPTGDLLWFPKSLAEPITHPPEETNCPVLQIVVTGGGTNVVTFRTP